jgi:hypothetical protein
VWKSVISTNCACHTRGEFVECLVNQSKFVIVLQEGNLLMKLVALTVILGLSSCVAVDPTTARAVQTKPNKGGIVTLDPPSDPRARAKADAIMKQTCGSKKAEIAEEGEAVVGSKSSSNTAHNSSKPSGIAGLSFASSSPTTETDSVQKQVTEWRITYECK